MRIPRIHAAALLAALFAVAGRPAQARAQENRQDLTVQRTQMARSDRDSMQTALLNAVDRDMSALFDAQRAYYAQHGRFASSFARLPQFPSEPASGISMTAGDDWYVVLGGGPDIGVSQQIVYFKKPEGTQEANRGGAGRELLVQTERIQGTMTRPR